MHGHSRASPATANRPLTALHNAAHGESRCSMNRENNALFADRSPREDGKPAFRGNAHGEGRHPMSCDNNASFSDRAPREDGKPAFRGNTHGEGRRPMNPDNNAPFSDRAPREDGKPAFHRDTHGASRGICKSNLKNGFPTRSSESPRWEAVFTSKIRARASCERMRSSFTRKAVPPSSRASGGRISTATRPMGGCGRFPRGKWFSHLARAAEEFRPLRVPWEDAVAFHAESGFLISRERRKNFDRYASQGRIRSPFTRKAAFAISASGSSTWESE